MADAEILSNSRFYLEIDGMTELVIKKVSGQRRLQRILAVSVFHVVPHQRKRVAFRKFVGACDQSGRRLRDASRTR